MEYALSTKFHCDDFPSFAALARRRRGQGAKFCRRRHDLTREGKSSFRFGSGRVGASRDLVPFRRRRPVPIIRRSRSADTGLSVETGPARRLFAEFQTVRARIRRVLRIRILSTYTRRCGSTPCRSVDHRHSAANVPRYQRTWESNLHGTSRYAISQPLFPSVSPCPVRLPLEIVKSFLPHGATTRSFRVSRYLRTCQRTYRKRETRNGHHRPYTALGDFYDSNNSKCRSCRCAVRGRTPDERARYGTTTRQQRSDVRLLDEFSSSDIAFRARDPGETREL